MRQKEAGGRSGEAGGPGGAPAPAPPPAPAAPAAARGGAGAAPILLPACARAVHRPPPALDHLLAAVLPALPAEAWSALGTALAAARDAAPAAAALRAALAAAAGAGGNAAPATSQAAYAAIVPYVCFLLESPPALESPQCVGAKSRVPQDGDGRCLSNAQRRRPLASGDQQRRVFRSREDARRERGKGAVAQNELHGIDAAARFTRTTAHVANNAPDAA